MTRAISSRSGPVFENATLVTLLAAVLRWPRAVHRCVDCGCGRLAERRPGGCGDPLEEPMRCAAGRPHRGHEGGDGSRKGRPAGVRHAGQAGREPGADHRQLRAEGGVPAARAGAAPSGEAAPQRRALRRERGPAGGRVGPSRSEGAPDRRQPGRQHQVPRPGVSLPDAQPARRAWHRLRSRAPLLHVPPEGPGQALHAVRAGHRHHRPHLHARVLRRRAQARPLRGGRQHAGAVPPDHVQGRDPRAARSRHQAEVGLPGHQRQGLQRGLHLGPAQRPPRRARRHAQRGGPQPQGAADRDRAGHRPGARAKHRRRSTAQPEALPRAGHQGPAGLRHQPPRRSATARRRRAPTRART